MKIFFYHYRKVKDTKKKTKKVERNPLSPAPSDSVKECMYTTSLNVCIKDIEWFDVEYGIYFMNETGIFIFSRVQGTSGKTGY